MKYIVIKESEDYASKLKLGEIIEIIINFEEQDIYNIYGGTL